MPELTQEEMDMMDAELGYGKKDPRHSLYKASFIDPEKQAEIVQLSESRKLPLTTVENKLPEVKRLQALENINVENHPITSGYLSNEKNSRISFDDIDNLKAMEDALSNPTPNTFLNAGAGMMDRVNVLTGNLVEFAGNIEEGVSTTLNEWGIPNAGMYKNQDGEWEWRNDLPKDYQSAIKQIGQGISDEQHSAYGYVPQYTWDKLKGDVSAGNLAGYVFEQGLQSVPDMIAASRTLPAYIASRTQGFAEARNENNGKAEVDVSDLAVSTIPAVAVSLLEKLGAKYVFKTKGASGLGGVARETGKAALAEGATEFIQEGIEYAGETLGTKKKFEYAEMLDRQLAGLVAGSGMGGTVRLTTASGEALVNRSNRKIISSINSELEQEKIDNFISLSQSNKTNGRDSDRYKSFVDSLDKDSRVYISNEAISEIVQSGIELRGYITNQLDGLGTDVSMTFSQFGADVASNEEIVDSLRDHVKMNPHSLTRAEMADGGEREIQSLIDKAQNEKRVLTESEEIYNDVKDQLISTNRHSEQTAKFSAALLPKYISRLSERTGRGVKDIYESIGFKIQGPENKSMPKTALQATQSGVSYNQKFDGIMIEETKTVVSTGKKVKIKQSAQKLWDREIKRKKQADKLRECLNG